jgi:hypothetical protein
MRWSLDYTYPVVSGKVRRSSPQAFNHERHRLIGLGLHAGVLAVWLANWLQRRRVATPSTGVACIASTRAVRLWTGAATAAGSTATSRTGDPPLPPSLLEQPCLPAAGSRATSRTGDPPQQGQPRQNIVCAGCGDQGTDFFCVGCRERFCDDCWCGCTGRATCHWCCTRPEPPPVDIVDSPVQPAAAAPAGTVLPLRGPRLAWAAAGATRSRGFQISRGDVQQLGASEGCRGCSSAVAGATGVPHTPACRERFRAALLGSEAGRRRLLDATRRRVTALGAAWAAEHSTNP